MLARRDLLWLLWLLWPLANLPTAGLTALNILSIDLAQVVIFTLISKLRPDKTIGKCEDYLRILNDYGVESKALDPEDTSFDLAPCREFLSNYRVCVSQWLALCCY